MTAKTKTEADTGVATAGATGGVHQHESAMTERKHQADIGVEEAHSTAVHDQTRSWNANVKRTYDVHQTHDLEGVGQRRQHFDRMVTHGLDHDNELRQLTVQAMQNAVETANMLSKQAVAHRDLAIDREWNIDEVAKLVAENTVFVNAIAAAVAKAVQEAKK